MDRALAKRPAKLANRNLLYLVERPATCLDLPRAAYWVAGF
jgi:hypothetical protein